MTGVRRGDGVGGVGTGFKRWVGDCGDGKM